MNFVDNDIAKSHNLFHPDFPIGCSTICEEVNPKIINPWKMYCSIKEAKKQAFQQGIGFVEAPSIEDCFGYEDFYHRPITTIGSVLCTAPFRTLQVNADGGICVMSRCYNLDIGNIKECSFEEAITGRVLQRLRDNIIQQEQYNPCKRCCAIM